MDRIEMIENFEKELEKIQGEKAELESAISKAYQRTWMYIEDRFVPKDSDKVQTLTPSFAVSGSCLYHDGTCGIVNGQKDYSIERLADLGYQIIKKKTPAGEKVKNGLVILTTIGMCLFFLILQILYQVVSRSR